MRTPKEKRWFTKSPAFADLDRKREEYAELRVETKTRLQKLGAHLLTAHRTTGAWRCSIGRPAVRLTATTADELIADVKAWLKKHERQTEEAA